MISSLHFRVGTRGSALAVTQTQLFCSALQRAIPEISFELVKITTSGDRIQDRFLSTVGGKGLFVKEIETALIKGEIDWAVHSMKDLPAELAEPCHIACIPERLSFEDVLLSAESKGLQDLPHGANIGTSSLRRRVQLKLLRPDLQFSLLRGNIDTRIRKLNEEAYDGIVLARAGLLRLQLEIPWMEVLPILPAPGQGALAIEARKEDQRSFKVLQALHHAPTAFCVLVERRIMQQLGGDCNLPLGVLCEQNKSEVQISAFLGLPDGSAWLKEEVKGSAGQTERMIELLLQRLSNKGSDDLLNKIRGLGLGQNE